MTTLRVDAVCAKASIQIPMKSDEAPRTKSASAASNIGVESFLGLDAVRSIVRYSVGKLIIVFICGLLGLKLKGVTEISTIRSPIVAIGKLSNVPDLFVQRQQCLVAWATAVYSGKRDFELISATSRVSNLHGKVDGWHGLHKDPYEDPDGIVEAARAKTASVASSFLTRVLHSTGCSGLEIWFIPFENLPIRYFVPFLSLPGDPGLPIKLNEVASERTWPGCLLKADYRLRKIVR